MHGKKIISILKNTRFLVKVVNCSIYKINVMRIRKMLIYCVKLDHALYSITRVYNLVNFWLNFYLILHFFSFPFQVMYTVQFPITGFSMLLSAGTFLYVATVHVLSEITQSSAHSPSDSAPSSTNNNTKLSRVELFLVVSGAFLPLLFNAIHSHSH